jgi:hypothetical protein
LWLTHKEADYPEAVASGATRTASAQTQRRIEQSMANLARLAASRMDSTLPWYRALTAEDRSWVGLVAQAGIGAFLSWFRHPGPPLTITADVFGTAPRELTRSVNLRQTLDLVRTVVDVVEDQVDQLAAPGDEHTLREAVLRYSR